MRIRDLLIKVYTVTYVLWFFIFIAAFIAGFKAEQQYINIFVAAFILLVVLPGIPVVYIYRGSLRNLLTGAYSRLRGERKRRRILDPYLASVNNKMRSMNRYFKGETSVSWSPVISIAYEAMLSLLQRIIIDREPDGIKLIEEFRRDKKLHLSFLAKELKEKGIITEEEFKSLEILRDLRNRVVHEDYHPTKEQAVWAFSLVKTMTKKYYPEAI
jgi:hypothetical protein